MQQHIDNIHYILNHYLHIYLVLLLLLALGIGGSYLGARAVIDSLKSTFYNYKKQETPQILYAGNSISPVYLNELIELINWLEVLANLRSHLLY